MSMNGQNFNNKSHLDLPNIEKGTHLKPKAGMKVTRETIHLPDAQTKKFHDGKTIDSKATSLLK